MFKGKFKKAIVITMLVAVILALLLSSLAPLFSN